MANMKRSLNNRSGYKGVGWSKSKERWRAYIMIDYVFYHLGYFDDPEIAHEAYKLAASTHRKEFARFA